MHVIKLDKRCPDITVRRKAHHANDYEVRVNGDLVELYDDPHDANWSRKIFISEEHKVVVKIDGDYYYQQSRNEIVFWTEVLERSDKKYFTPVLGWGTTSRLERNYNKQKPDRKYVPRRIFWCAQKLIPDSRSIDSFSDMQKLKIRKEYYNVVRDVLVPKYNLADFDYRQVKVSNRGRMWVHDYGFFDQNDYGEDLDSSVLPLYAEKVRKYLYTGKKQEVGV